MKDWTDLHQQAPNAVLYHWLPLLGWEPPSADELAGWRWGPASDDPEPGIVIHGSLKPDAVVLV